MFILDTVHVSCDLRKHNEVVLHTQSIRNGLESISIMSEALSNSLAIASVTASGAQTSEHPDGMDGADTSGVMDLIVKMECME